MTNRAVRFQAACALGLLAQPLHAETAHAPAEFGFLGGLYFPAKDRSLVGPGFAPESFKSPAPELGARGAFLPIPNAGLELEGAVMPAKTETGHSGGFFAVRGHLLGQLPVGSLTPFVVAGVGRLGAGSTTTGTGVALAWHFGIGAKYALDDFVSVRVDVRETLSDQQGGSGLASSPEVLLGLSFKIGAPSKAVPPPPPPPASVDTDQDGKRDDVDQCPEEAAFTATGCPPGDADQDSVKDDKDACPNEPGSPPCGCPPRDQDGDKVIDELDKCPTEAGPLEGCPDPDADRDGVPLPEDRCPDQQETKNGYEDADGCPDDVPEKVKKFTGVIQGIEFDKAKDTIRPVSRPTLDAAVAVLVEYPALRVLVSGHTDTDGDRATNVDLSRRRAESVKAYFVTKGVDPARIETRGVGPDEPIADNATAAGRQKNRRIEFALLPNAPKPEPAPKPANPPPPSAPPEAPTSAAPPPSPSPAPSASPAAPAAPSGGQ